MIGLHVGKAQDPKDQRAYATSLSLEVFQSNFGSVQSFDIPSDFAMRPTHEEGKEPLWLWHAAYIAGAKPSESSRDGCFYYLKKMIQAAKWWNVKGIVIHTGATVGKSGFEVRDSMLAFLKPFQDSGVQILVELGASISQFNSCPQLLARAIQMNPHVGWCLDLHHSYAAGVSYSDLRDIIRETPPTLCHCNFPGTVFCSSKDVHGWRMTPEVFKEGKTIKRRGELETKILCDDWDETIRLLKSLNVPLIIEGSGFSGNYKTELDLVRAL